MCTQYKQAPGALSYKVKDDCGVNPCLLHSNKSRPHLSTYITTQEEQEGVVLMCERSTRAAKHEAFSRTKEASNFQFSLRAEELPSNNLESSQIWRG